MKAANVSGSEGEVDLQLPNRRASGSFEFFQLKSQYSNVKNFKKEKIRDWSYIFRNAKLLDAARIVQKFL